MRYVIGLLRKVHLRDLFLLPYTIWLTKLATGSFFPLRFAYSGRFIPVKISKAKTGKIFIKDKIIFESWGNGDTPISIIVGENAALNVENTFLIGQGTLILACAGSFISIKGKLKSTGSGITCNTRIMAERSIDIGYDCIIAWGCCITDSNWHELSGTSRCVPVSIGNQVWVGHDVTILPGAKIGDGCVIGAKSLVLGREYEPFNLLVGNPARIVRENVTWRR
jgi:acetyltransferase-like isoleucine patch superfamily enzyme